MGDKGCPILTTIYCLRTRVSVVTPVAINKYAVINYPQKARGFLTDISYNPAKWCSARKNTSISGTAQKVFRNIFESRIPF